MQTRLGKLGVTRIHAQFVGPDENTSFNDYASCSDYGQDKVEGLKQLFATWGVTFDHAEAVSP